MSDTADDRHYPGQAAIDGYGSGGFRFAGMSHKGSLLILPSGMYAWPASSVAEITEANLERIFAEPDGIDFLLVGTGRDPALLSAPLRSRLKEIGLSFDAMPTGGATSTYNILLEERRRVAAALLAVG